MSLPPAPFVLAATAAIANPLEIFMATLNTSPYFVGFMMLFLNLGGRFLGMEMSKNMEAIFQNPWVRKFLIFVIIFIGTRNIIGAFFATILYLILLSLINENSEFFLFKGLLNEEAIEEPVLTPDEYEIWKRLHEKQQRLQGQKIKKETPSLEKTQDSEEIYYANMKML